MAHMMCNRLGEWRYAERLGEDAGARTRRHIVDTELNRAPFAHGIDAAVTDVEPHRRGGAEQKPGNRRAHAQERRACGHGRIELAVDRRESVDDLLRTA